MCEFPDHLIREFFLPKDEPFFFAAAGRVAFFLPCGWCAGVFSGGILTLPVQPAPA